MKSNRSRLRRGASAPIAAPAPAWESLESRTLLYGFGGFTFDLSSLASGLWRNLIHAADEAASGASHDGGGDTAGDGNKDTLKAQEGLEKAAKKAEKDAHNDAEKQQQDAEKEAEKQKKEAEKEAKKNKDDKGKDDGKSGDDSGGSSGSGSGDGDGGDDDTGKGNDGKGAGNDDKGAGNDDKGQGSDDEGKGSSGEGNGKGDNNESEFFKNRPVAAINGTPTLTKAANGSLTVSITFTDDKKVRAKTIDPADISVRGPSGQSLSVTGVTISPESDNDRIVATYTIAAPGGGWGAADNGTYSVALRPLQVFDNSFLPADSVEGSFDVNIAASTDAAAPGATISASDVKAGGDTHSAVTVVYTDDAGININTIDRDDLTITGPKGGRYIASVDINANADGTRVEAVYTFSAPGSAWGPEDNGAYKVSLNADAVRDNAGKGAVGAAVSFNVNVPRPDPVDPDFGNGGGSGGGGTGTPGGGGTGSGGTDNGGGSTGGGGGAVTTAFVAEAVVTQDDGKIVVAGRQGDLAAGTSQAVIQRFNPDGSLDKTFGQGGRVVSAAGKNDAYYSVALASGGRIVVAGSQGGDVLVSRYNANGNIDGTFGHSGIQMADFGAADDTAYAMALAVDGTLVVAGQSAGNFAIAKLRTDGSLMPDFGSGGMVVFDLGSNADVAGAVTFQGDSPVIVGASGGKVGVVRLRPTGEADTSFSGDGLLLTGALTARTDANFADRSTAAAVQADGKLLLANRSAAGDFAVARLNADGSLDSTFGTGGVATVDFDGGDDDADAVLVQDTGEIIVIGTSLKAGVGNTAVAALNADGSLVADFGTGGKLLLSPDAAPSSRELHLGDLVLRAFGTKQSDGRVVVGTSSGSQQAVNPSSSLRRLNVPGVKSQALGTQVGTFGTGTDGKRTALTLTDADGTRFTLSASRGSGRVYLSGGRYNLMVSDAAGGAAVTMKSAGGDGRVSLGAVMIGGTLRSFTAKTADVAGTLYASGSIGKLAMGQLTGIIAAAGSIGTVSLASMTGARVMSAASLGADGKLGGTGADADTFGPGSIAALRVAGAIQASTVSAGLDPVDGVFNNADDRVVGGASSAIRSVVAKSTDESSRFIAGSVVSLRLPGVVDLAADARVKVMG